MMGLTCCRRWCIEQWTCWFFTSIDWR